MRNPCKGDEVMDASFARYRNYLAMTLLFIIVLIGTIFSLRRPDPTPMVISTITPRATPTIAVLIIDVRGAVANPGVYTLPEGSRVQDAVKSAGNSLSNGDTSALNLARKLNDGEQIFVPKIGDATSTPSASSTSSTKPSTACLSYKDASAHVNETTCVRGSVSSAEKSGSTFFIYFDDSTTSFYAVSFNHTWDNLHGRCVEISGKIALFRGRAQMVIDKEDQLSNCR